MSDYMALGILLLIASFFVYAVAPPRWQTPLGFALIVCMAPAGLGVLALLAQPAVLVPVALLIGILLARAS